MPQAFFSHSSKDKTLVLKVAEHLNRSLIKTWVDQAQMPGGSSLPEKIASGIRQSKYFLAFISQDYIDSKWCMDELKQVYPLLVKNDVKIIPVLLTARDKLDLTKLVQKDFLENLLGGTIFVEFDSYREQEGLDKIANALWQNEFIRIDPVKIITAGGVELQEIKFTLQIKTLPSDFLQTWGFDIEDFVAMESDDPKPIRFGLPVLFSGISINWLITYLTIPLKNRRTIFIYNNFSKDYICVYALEDGSHRVGKVLK